MKMTVEEFKEKFRKIKDAGYVPSQRRGPTGIGYTLETLLGISENNDASPDIDGAELKAHRSNSNNARLFQNFSSWNSFLPLEKIA